MESGPPHLNRITAVLLDVDGTLIDSNGAHAESWAAALTEHGYAVDAAFVRPLVGMGGDKLLPTIAGIEEDSAKGRAIGDRKKELFAACVPALRPMPGARALLLHLQERRKDIVVATSADEKEMQTLLEQAGVSDLIPRRTSKDDAGGSKPDPDIVQAALARAGVGGADAAMIGDTLYDVEAAARAGVATIALRCGGYWKDVDLHGAVAICDDPQALLDYWLRLDGIER